MVATAAAAASLFVAFSNAFSFVRINVTAFQQSTTSSGGGSAKGYLALRFRPSCKMHQVSFPKFALSLGFLVQHKSLQKIREIESVETPRDFSRKNSGK